MSRVACLCVLLAAASATAADLPPGALVRLGDDRFRAGSGVYYIAMSPDGKQFATVRGVEGGISALEIWDVTTGQPVRAQRINDELFKGCVWGPKGGLAIFAKVDPGDFLVWEFTDPKAAPPPVFKTEITFSERWRIAIDRPRDGDEYIDFELTPDGERVAALWKSAKEKYTVRVYELKPTQTAAKLRRIATLDLGAEGASGVRISADGKTVVTFRPLADIGECTATSWDVATGKPTTPVRVTHNWWGIRNWSPWYWPALTPDGRELVDYLSVQKGEGFTAIGTKEGGYELVELATGKRRMVALRPLANEDPREQYPAHNLCFPSARIHIEAGHLHTRIVDLTTGKELGLLKGHRSAPTAVAVSANGSRLVTADRDGLIRLWDAKTLRPLHDAPGHRSPIAYAQLSPDGKRVLTWSHDETARLWDLATGKELRVFTDVPRLWGLRARNEPTFFPDGTTILYGTKDRLTARDLQTGLEVPLPGDMAKLDPLLAVFSPEGKSVVTWGLGDTCEVWDWPSGKKRFELDGIREVYDPGFSSDGSVLFVNSYSPQRWDAKTGKELPPAWKEDRTKVLKPLAALRPNPRWLLHDSNEGDPRVIEAGADGHVSRFRLHRIGEYPMLRGAWDAALSPAGGQYAVVSLLDEEVQLNESATSTVRRVLNGHRGSASILGFTPDGTKLLTAGGDHTVLVWDMRLQTVPLPEAVKKETNAAKLWDTLATDGAKDAYLAMARLAREPEAAIKMAKLKLKPAAKGDRDTDATTLADARAIELLEALDTDDARALIKELAGGHADAFRTQEAKRAQERDSHLRNKR